MEQCGQFLYLYFNILGGSIIKGKCTSKRNKDIVRRIKGRVSILTDVCLLDPKLTDTLPT